MTPAEFLADEADLCGLVQAAFPESSGLRLHPWHYIDVLYSSSRALNKDESLIFQPHLFRNHVCYMQFDLKLWDDKVKLPGTTVVRFDPEKRIPLFSWMMKGKHKLDKMRRLARMWRETSNCDEPDRDAEFGTGTIGNTYNDQARFVQSD